MKQSHDNKSILSRFRARKKQAKDQKRLLFTDEARSDQEKFTNLLSPFGYMEIFGGDAADVPSRWKIIGKSENGYFVTYKPDSVSKEVQECLLALSKKPHKDLIIRGQNHYSQSSMGPFYPLKEKIENAWEKIFEE